jgi:transposase-like protein
MTSFVEIYRRFPTREAAIAHLEQVRWADAPACPYCQWCGVSRNRDASREATAARWKCQKCLRSFSVTVGTIFHNSHVDLQRWFLLISLMLNAKKGLSAMQAARDLEMRRATVWSMMHRVRAALKDDDKLLAGIVEMDEAYVGGKPRRTNRKDDHDPKPPGRGTSKVPVVGAVERGGRMKARAVNKAEMTGPDMDALTRAFIDTRRSVVTTDEYSGYNGLNKFVAHRTINHSVSYLERDLFSDEFGPIHTNTIESVWAILKRAVMGQFHHVSRKYLPLYLNEITFRYNARNSDGVFDGLLHLAVNP